LLNFIIVVTIKVTEEITSFLIRYQAQAFEYILKYSSINPHSQKCIHPNNLSYKLHIPRRPKHEVYLINFFEVIIIGAIGRFCHDNSPEWPPISLQLQSKTQTRRHLESNRDTISNLANAIPVRLMSITWYLSVFGHGAENARLNPSMILFSGFVTPGEGPKVRNTTRPTTRQTFDEMQSTRDIEGDEKVRGGGFLGLEAYGP
jgi:hypothetical protein